MSGNHRQNGQAGDRLSGEPPKFIRVSPASLTMFVALNGFAVAAVVLAAALALHFAATSWKAPAKECPDRQSAILLPPVVPIPAPCRDGHPDGNVALDPDRNPWINELIDAVREAGKSQTAVSDAEASPAREVKIGSENNPWIREVTNALQQIQAKLNGPDGNVTLDPQQNPWINDLVEALEANRFEHEVNVAVDLEKPAWADDLVAAMHGMVELHAIDPDQNKWVNDLVEALQQIQAKLNGPDGNVTLDPDRNPWINDLIKALREADRPGRDVNVAVDLEKPAWADDLVAALHDVVELRAIDPAIRVEVRKHMACGENQRLTLSDVIRFPIGTSSLEGAAPDRIDNFLCRVGDRATGWRIFGFASGEGGKDMNQKLSRQRACQVSKYICEKHGCESCGIDCGKRPEDDGGEAEVAHTCAVPGGNPESDLFIHPLGEEHFINGVADSRSAVIAACLGETTAQDVRPCGH